MVSKANIKNKYTDREKNSCLYLVTARQVATPIAGGACFMKSYGTMEGAYGDPENTGVGYNAVLTELGNHDVPQGWIQTPRPNITPNTNPGPPVSWNDPSNPDDPLKLL